MSYRYLSLELAGQPWVFGPLILLAMISVVDAYLRTTGEWEREQAPPGQTEPQPESRRDGDRRLEPV